MNCTRAARRSGSTTSSGACSNGSISTSCSPAPGSATRPRPGWRRSSSGWPQLHTAFSQNVLADESNWVLWLRAEQDLAGLPASVRDAAKGVAVERGDPDAWAITTSRSIVVPFLTFSDRRDLREQAYRAWKARGENDGEHDNRPIAREILKLRTEQARLMGYPSYADFALVDRMAGTPAAVQQLLQRVWEPAKARAREEYSALQAQAAAMGQPTTLEPWDWRYYAEKVRQARYDVDDAQVKPYFPLERVAEAAFDCAHRLFGVQFVARPDLKAYHPDVRVYEVRRGERTVAVFLHDNFARSTKRSGAWMSALPLAVARRRRGRFRSSSTTTTSPRPRAASRRCCRSTTCARCSTSSATACTACCRT